ncbi:MAG TPA: 2-oxo-4-hydroxy-4-carboxy-5-ureidoimidazoline decarboxylase, partial [Actinomycetota bacterium]|nr:2-oxo-4-hydroxy-4-carboxy-5-ureidoimidazoline decarboxylase [Actinomycetota bacterium]
SNLQGDSLNEFAVDSPVRFTHLRFNIHPDGGVARLRIHGEPFPDLRRLAGPGGDAELAGLANGGMLLSASDRFFSSPHTLNTVGDARDMGDGWETRRRRGPGHDWVVLRLAAEGAIHRIEVDTTHFKGNHPESCSVEAARGPGGLEGLDWREVVPRKKLRPHARHAFDVVDAEPAAHVRLNIFPDGGVARLRVHGRVTDDGWRSWGVRWLNARTAGAGEADLLACCGSTEWARRVLAGRPYGGFDELLRAATVAWDSVGPDGWRQAFAAHPRIGESASSAWSRQEQSGAAGASTETMVALAEGTRAYEERFGHVFLVDATGKTAEQMLSALRERLGNDPDAELRVAAGEQARITRIRLEKLVRP